MQATFGTDERTGILGASGVVSSKPSSVFYEFPSVMNGGEETYVYFRFWVGVVESLPLRLMSILRVFFCLILVLVVSVIG